MHVIEAYPTLDRAFFIVIWVMMPQGNLSVVFTPSGALDTSGATRACHLGSIIRPGRKICDQCRLGGNP
jgi:hypothetical protein